MKEEEIRPQVIFDEYLELAERDTESYFRNVATEHISCPACGEEGDHSFTKSGFSYCLCEACNTLYVSPRPLAESFSRYYTEAPSVEFWATTFYEVTAEARREKLWKPKAGMIQDELTASGADDHQIIDIGGGFGIFAEEMEKLSGRSVTVIEPGPMLAERCRSRGLKVVEKFLENVEEADLPEGGRAFVSFELFEHLHDPRLFLEQLSSLMKAGDRFIFTTLSGTGIDIQVLWEHSKSVSPPHHLNFLNPHSARLLLEDLGFDQVHVTTPGKLDISILENNQEHIEDRFVRSFITYATDEQKADWQTMLAESGWSSHMMVSCRKP